MSSPYHPLIDVLKQVNSNSCPLHFNFHCHTTLSDGSLDPLELAAQALSIGLTHFAVTDHHTTRSYEIISNRFNELKMNGIITPHLWTGIEISCILNKCLVHVLGLGFDHKHQSMRPYINGEAPTGNYLQANYVSEALHEAGGLVLLAHPARYRVSHHLLIESASEMKFDGAEVWYDYDFNIDWQYTPFLCNQIDDLARNYNLLASCGTDSHGHTLLGR